MTLLQSLTSSYLLRIILLVIVVQQVIVSSTSWSEPCLLRFGICPGLFGLGSLCALSWTNNTMAFLLAVGRGNLLLMDGVALIVSCDGATSST